MVSWHTIVMFPEDERSFERVVPFEQIIEPHFVWNNGERRWSGMSIDDRLYGKFEFDADNPGDAAIMELLYSDPVQRLAMIEQLVLPKGIATRPETTDFTRFEHSVGCMLLTRKLCGSSEQQIRALMHDISQTAFSHLGDWLEQGMDGDDNHHDSVQKEYMLKFGIDNILAAHGFDFDDVFDPAIQDFVERPSPDLCIDRVDYSLREFARWTCPDDVAGLIDELRVQDDMIVFTNQASARLFSDSYQKLFWRHWAEYDHAIRETIFFSAIKQSIEEGVISKEDMYSVDQAIMVKMKLWGSEKVQDLLYLASMTELDFGIIKGTQDALRVDDFADDNEHLYMQTRPFKPRYVDPSFIDDDGSRLVLSWIDGDHRASNEIHISTTEWHNGKVFFEKIGDQLLTFARIPVEPQLKKVLSQLPDFA